MKYLILVMSLLLSQAEGLSQVDLSKNTLFNPIGKATEILAHGETMSRQGKDKKLMAWIVAKTEDSTGRELIAVLILSNGKVTGVNLYPIVSIAGKTYQCVDTAKEPVVITIEGNAVAMRRPSEEALQLMDLQ